MQYDIELIAQTLLRIAGIYKPAEASILGELFAVGKQFNELLKEIRDQTEANEPEVWAKVREDFEDAVSAWEKSTNV